MGHQMENPSRKCADTAGQKHIAELADGRVGENALEVVLSQRDGSRVEGRDASEHRYQLHGKRRRFKQEMRAGDHVNPRCHHGGGVNQGAHRCRSFHRVGQPDIERHLGGLAHRAEEQEQANGRQSDFGLLGQVSHQVKQRFEIHDAEGPEDQNDSEQESEITDAVDDEGFLAGVGCGLFQKIKTDQQVGTDADAFPTDKHQQVVVRHDQDQHGEQKQVQVGKEAVKAVFLSHVADRIDMNEESYAGDHKRHNQRETVVVKAEGSVKPSRLNPGEVVYDQGNLVGREVEESPRDPQGNTKGGTCRSTSEERDQPP